MWAVLTRLEEPKNAGLTVLQKLKLYNGKSLPGFTEDNITELRDQAVNEGMLGISPRYVQDKISNALVAHLDSASINPFMVMNELETGLKHHSLIRSGFQEQLRFEGISDTDALVTRTFDPDPAIPSYNGGKFPLTTFLASRVRRIVHDRDSWRDLPDQVREWFEVQERKSVIPEPDQMLVETFPRGERNYLVCYPFEGRLAHQTLGMLLTRRMERAGLKPLGFVASEYALSVWALEDLRGEDMDQLFHEDMLGDDLDAWLEESALMKRTFRNNALISGLIERRYPKHEKTGRQITFSTDLIYDVLRSHEPDHILLQAARQEAGDGLLDIRRLADALKRIRGRIVHAKLDHISPFAVPVMLEIGKEPVFSGDSAEAVLREAEEDLVRDAMS
jgi:ATP-dependent Lhr-like helicase